MGTREEELSNFDIRVPKGRREVCAHFVARNAVYPRGDTGTKGRISKTKQVGDRSRTSEFWDAKRAHGIPNGNRIDCNGARLACR
jgi:hypothetical protein